MLPNYHCKSCGHISTYRPDYTRIEGVLVCKSCAEENGKDENVTRWIAEAVAAKKAESESVA